MRPAALRSFVQGHVYAAGFAAETLILGGDHLERNPWRALPATEAMAHAETMVSEYVQSGFAKIHLDDSMACGSDPAQLSDEVVAQRTAQLCKAAERACASGDGPVHVI
jgi:D-tagatose-1,6-bisphosphate aldolase subunit GatZ/KbaZ